MSSRTTITLIALVGASACAEGADRTTASGSPVPPPLGACLDANEATQRVGSARVEGRVEEVGLGIPDSARVASCPLGGGLRFGPPGLGNAALLAQVSWLRIRGADNQEMILSALAEGFAFPLAIGDFVRGEISVGSHGFNAEVTSFETRTAEGSLLYWAGFGTRLTDIDPPQEIVLSAGTVEAQNKDECLGAYQVRALDVSVDGLAVSVPSGARVEVGAWSVVNASFQEQTGMPACADALASRIRVAVWTRAAQVPDNGGMGGPCYSHLPIEQAEGAPQYLCLPDGTLSRECAPSTPCPGQSRCVERLCRPPASTN